ncbi:raffinose synthase protein [Grosmannia clavigera kw1407]|uniref:Raffinose synthase protein n=1 Tax=Grosmannia clavigera (strain kw1407 / UAMH 11150) TaxID=655863 RepID=F0XMZ4_GROCL|nr:raffinose synthase protein [Grosmannia clavigera kw1407]EFX00759.1 raffinose synthase protein [Grosmannia clavigera kw1407]
MGDGEYSFAAEFTASLPKKAIRVGKKRGSTAGGGAQAAVMGVTVSTYPPLGQVTQLASGDSVGFYAMLETKRVSGDDRASAWEVAVWHSTSSGADEGEADREGEWAATELSAVDADDETKPRSWLWLQDEDETTVRHCYGGTLNVGLGPAWFTVRFRRRATAGSEASVWRWVNEEQETEDGTLVIRRKSGRPAEADLSNLIHGLNPAFSVTSPRSQVAGTTLWSLETTVAGATDTDESGYTDTTIGTPWGDDLLRWLALVRVWTPWLAPSHGRTRLQLDRDAVLCACLSQTGQHLVLLAVSGRRGLLSVLRTDEAGHLVLHVRSDSLVAEQATLLVAVADDVERANAAVMYHARGLIGWEAKEEMTSQGDDQTEIPDILPQYLETWHDGLGFCTWNALGQALSEAKILAAMDALAAAGIRVGSLIIDDGWQTLGHATAVPPNHFQRGWAAFEAEPTQFPHGLAHTVHQIRARHPHVRHVAVWHALLGYWGGVAPDSELARRYATEELQRAHPPRRHLPIAGPMTVVVEADVRRLYDDFYRFLAAAGIDGVKTDAQFMTDTWLSARARRRLAPAYEAAWTVAGLRHLQARAVSCMSQTPPLLFRTQLPVGRPALAVRNSDDFFPDVPDSHPWHVWTNAHNSLLSQHLNVLPDWDMFQTVHDYSAFHAAARCISGGPVYITDAPGRYDTALIDQIAAPSLAGHHVVFRPDRIGRALRPYAAFHDRALLLVAAYHGDSAGSGILALFNVADRPLAELIPLACVPGVYSTASPSSLSSPFFSPLSSPSSSNSPSSPPLHIARLHSSGRLSRPVGSDALLPVSLGVRGYDILTVYKPLAFSFADHEPPLYVANLGLVRKMAAAASVVSTSAACRQSGRRAVELTAAFKALGIVGIYVSALPTLTVADNFLVTIRGLPIPPTCVTKSASDPCLLEIDVERAWKDLQQTPDWNNELRLTVHIMLD